MINKSDVEYVQQYQYQRNNGVELCTISQMIVDLYVTEGDIAFKSDIINLTAVRDKLMRRTGPGKTDRPEQYK